MHSFHMPLPDALGDALKKKHSKKYIFYFNISISDIICGCWQFEAKLGKTLVCFRLIGLGQWEGPRGVQSVVH